MVGPGAPERDGRDFGPGPRLRRRAGARSLAALAVLIPGLGGLGAGAASAAPASAPPLSWHVCDTAYRCATLRVPLDYSDPAGATIGLALIEQAASGAHVLGDIVLNPGGPGASGLQFLESTSFPPALRASFNLISFDPRGVGASDPVTCVGASGIRSLVALNPDPRTPAEVAGVVAATKAFDQACAKHSPATLLHNVSTLDTVRDLDALRAALGQAQLNYFGFSYGTYIGELYAQDFPGHLRSMVLDGTEDPALSDSAFVAGQAVGFETDLRDFFAWCGTNKSCSTELPQGARKAYAELLAQVGSGTTLYAYLLPMFGGKQPVTLGVAATAVLGSLYSNQTWPFLAQAIAQGLGGNGALLAELAYSYAGLLPNGQYANVIAANTAITCSDRAYPTSTASYQQLAAQLTKLAPDFGAFAAWSDFDCAFWPVTTDAKPARGPRR